MAYNEVMDTKDNMVILLHNELVGDGEPGDPLSRPVQDIIAALTAAGWYPVDFGENTENTTELWFKWTSNPIIAREQARYFIGKGGDV